MLKAMTSVSKSLPDAMAAKKLDVLPTSVAVACASCSAMKRGSAG
jgi:hypothetical protein